MLRGSWLWLWLWPWWLAALLLLLKLLLPLLMLVLLELAAAPVLGLGLEVLVEAGAPGCCGRRPFVRLVEACIWQKSQSQLLLHRPGHLSNMQGRQPAPSPIARCTDEPKESGASPGLAAESSCTSLRAILFGRLSIGALLATPSSLGEARPEGRALPLSELGAAKTGRVISEKMLGSIAWSVGPTITVLSSPASDGAEASLSNCWDSISASAELPETSDASNSFVSAAARRCTWAAWSDPVDPLVEGSLPDVSPDPSPSYPEDCCWWGCCPSPDPEPEPELPESPPPPPLCLSLCVSWPGRSGSELELFWPSDVRLWLEFICPFTPEDVDSCFFCELAWPVVVELVCPSDTLRASPLMTVWGARPEIRDNTSTKLSGIPLVCDAALAASPASSHLSSSTRLLRPTTLCRIR
mmetsp:Transcript_79850/g.165999  ORF Transcript_79850/g.165999 Transcript_79850/m.165999 type:complete len:412 (+) Transcript_79850:594-1829(+)